MTDDNLSCGVLAETLIESKQLDPNDPLDEVVPSTLISYKTSNRQNAQVNKLLAESRVPRTIRNLLKAYFHTDVSADAYKHVYSLVSPRSGSHFLITKVWKHPVSVSGVLRDTLLDTYYFPLPNNAPLHTLVGCVIKGYLIREVYEQYGVTYILTESVKSEYEVHN